MIHIPLDPKQRYKRSSTVYYKVCSPHAVIQELPVSRLGMSVTTQGGSGRQFVTGL